MTIALICPHHQQGHQWLTAGQWVLNGFLSPGFSPKLLTSNLSILKLALYFTEKINEMCFTNNQDLWYVLKWSVGFFLTFLSAWALKGHQLCFGTRLLHADRGKGLDCCLTTNNPQTLLISLPPQLWGMENGILQKRHRGEGQYWKVTFLEVNIKYSDSSFTWHHWRFPIIFWSRCYYSNMWTT